MSILTTLESTWSFTSVQFTRINVVLSASTTWPRYIFITVHLSKKLLHPFQQFYKICQIMPFPGLCSTRNFNLNSRTFQYHSRHKPCYSLICGANKEKSQERMSFMVPTNSNTKGLRTCLLCIHGDSWNRKGCRQSLLCNNHNSDTYAHHFNYHFHINLPCFTKFSGKGRVRLPSLAKCN